MQLSIKILSSSFNPHKKMKFAVLLLAGAAIFAYVGVEGKPKELSFSAKERIDGKLNKILQILTQEVRTVSCRRTWVDWLTLALCSD